MWTTSVQLNIKSCVQPQVNVYNSMCSYIYISVGQPRQNKWLLLYSDNVGHWILSNLYDMKNAVGDYFLNLIFKLKSNMSGISGIILLLQRNIDRESEKST